MTPFKTREETLIDLIKNRRVLSRDYTAEQLHGLFGESMGYTVEEIKEGMKNV